jgi:hypothetical protein
MRGDGDILTEFGLDVLSQSHGSRLVPSETAKFDVDGDGHGDEKQRL